ncbi:MAG: hypothetical protein AAF844_15675 [Pseudomonadota bacterium]
MSFILRTAVLCIAVAMGVPGLTGPATAQPANASLAVWLAEGAEGAELEAHLRVVAASPPSEIATMDGGRETYASLVATHFPVEAILDETGALLERKLDEPTLEVVQRFHASIFGIRLATRRRQIAGTIKTPQDAMLLAEEGRRILDEAGESDRGRSYRAFVPPSETLNIAVATALAFDHAVWAPLRATGFFGTPEDPAAYRARLETTRAARTGAMRKMLAERYAYALSPFSDGLLRWSADHASSPQGRRFERAYIKALAGALLPRAHALGQALLAQFGPQKG